MTATKQDTTLKVFDRWDVSGIVVEDPGLVNQINVSPRMVPSTGGQMAGSRFHKGKVFIVERLVKKVMVPGHKSKKHFKTSGYCTGKILTAYNLVKNAFEIIEAKTKENPVLVFVRAVENAAPREEIITIEYGGARYPKAVECAPQRRVDQALKYMVQGSYQKSFNSKKSSAECLAEEILNAYNLSQNSAAISKKLEVERQADSSR
ncbi:30S ribosomal protein S7 [Candidatus Woesearchaeota archaeon]|nr:30S ribosomal protein S7 [Candidatus Woesearchaeota archaeon]